MSLIGAVWFIRWTVMTGGGTATAFMTRQNRHNSRHITAGNVPSLDNNLEIAIGNCTG